MSPSYDLLFKSTLPITIIRIPSFNSPVFFIINYVEDQKDPGISFYEYSSSFPTPDNYCLPVQRISIVSIATWYVSSITTGCLISADDFECFNTGHAVRGGLGYCHPETRDFTLCVYINSLHVFGYYSGSAGCVRQSRVW